MPLGQQARQQLASVLELPDQASKVRTQVDAHQRKSLHSYPCISDYTRSQPGWYARVLSNVRYHMSVHSKGNRQDPSNAAPSQCGPAQNYKENVARAQTHANTRSNACLTHLIEAGAQVNTDTRSTAGNVARAQTHAHNR
jgi:hypothetical protein